MIEDGDKVTYQFDHAIAPDTVLAGWNGSPISVQAPHRARSSFPALQRRSDRRRRAQNLGTLDLGRDDFWGWRFTPPGQTPLPDEHALFTSSQLSMSADQKSVTLDPPGPNRDDAGTEWLAVGSKMIWTPSTPICSVVPPCHVWEVKTTGEVEAVRTSDGSFRFGRRGLEVAPQRVEPLCARPRALSAGGATSAARSSCVPGCAIAAGTRWAAESSAAPRRVLLPSSLLPAGACTAPPSCPVCARATARARAAVSRSSASSTDFRSGNGAAVRSAASVRRAFEVLAASAHTSRARSSGEIRAPRPAGGGTWPCGCRDSSSAAPRPRCPSRCAASRTVASS